MAGNTFDPDNFPSERKRKTQKGHDVRSLGPSDSSDTGSDSTGVPGADDTSDRSGTGERMSADERQRTRSGGDSDTDRIVDADEAGVGYGILLYWFR